MARQLELFDATGTLQSKETRSLLHGGRIRPCTLCKALMLLRQKGMVVCVGDAVPSIDGCMLSPENRRFFACMKNRQEDRVQSHSGKRFLNRYGRRRLTGQIIQHHSQL